MMRGIWIWPKSIMDFRGPNLLISNPLTNPEIWKSIIFLYWLKTPKKAPCICFPYSLKCYNTKINRCPSSCLLNYELPDYFSHSKLIYLILLRFCYEIDAKLGMGFSVWVVEFENSQPPMKYERGRRGE